MSDRIDRRTYDVLRLIDTNEPIGSIRLVDLLERHGYSIKDRTVRLALSDLDERGLTEKVPGKGRRLTERGRTELAKGDVSGRLEQIRTRIATLTSQVTYDPTEDAGEVAATSVFVPDESLADALATLARLAETPLSPLLVSVDVESTDGPADTVRIDIPSSLTIYGVLLSHGINVDLQAAGIVEYLPDPTPDQLYYEDSGAADHGGAILRYTDVLSGEGSTIDATSLLIEARRTTVRELLEGTDPALIVADNHKIPVVRYDEARDLGIETRNKLGGVLDFRRPREAGPFADERPTWNFASLSYGAGETAISLLVESGHAEVWETLHGLVPRSEFERVTVVAAEYEDED